MLQTNLQTIKNFKNVSTEESDWESKFIFDPSGAELVRIDHFSNFQMVREESGGYTKKISEYW